MAEMIGLEMILKTLAEEIHSLSTALTSSGQTVTAVKSSYSEEDVHAVLREKSRAGFSDKIRYLLRIKYNAQKLADVPPERYAELINDVKNLD